MGLSHGYECGNCGYVPDYNELANGSCPYCIDERLEIGKRLPVELEVLPVGSHMQVLRKNGARSLRTGKYTEFNQTIFFWTLSERDANGKAVWCSKKWLITFVDATGIERHAYAQGYAEERYHDPLRMTSDAVAHFTLGEMTYKAWYVIHDMTPTHHTLAVQSLMQDMNWPPPVLEHA